MVNADFKWNHKVMKTRRVIDGQIKIVDIEPGEVVRNPTGHQLESIVYAQGLVLAELMERTEGDAQRMLELRRSLGHGRNPAPQVKNEEVQI